MSPTAPSRDPNLHFEGPSTQDEQSNDTDTVETVTATPSTINILEEQRKDIETIMGIVNGLSTDMKAIKESIEKIKAEQQRSTNDTNVTTTRPTSETSIIEDIEILTENVSELTRKVNVADSLKLELQGMKRRLQRLENAKSSSRLATSISAREASEEALQNTLDISPSFASDSVSAIEESVRSKRKSIRSNAQGNELSEAVLESELISPSLQAEDSRSKEQSTNDVSAGAKDDSYHDISTFSKQPLNSAAKIKTQKGPLLLRSTSAASHSQGTPTHFGLQAPPSGKRRQLNNTHFLLASDPEDSDYEPRRRRSSVTPPSNRGHRSAGKAHFRLPTPEWEKSDWEGPLSSSLGGSASPRVTNRGRGIKRRGLSGPSVLYSERHPTRRRRTVALSDDDDDEQLPLGTYGLGGYDSEGFPLTKTGERDSRVKGAWARSRNEDGILLKRDGKIDGRSLRQRREREIRESVARAKKGLGKQDNDRGFAATAVTTTTVPTTTNGLERPVEPQQTKGNADPSGTRPETAAPTIKTEPSTSAASFQTHVDEASKRDAARHENVMRRMAELLNPPTKKG
ncbi:MAG: hypothetical protein LQ351_007260 [Letrouitia transgressa]|nr:MAG: hypothetical protein LQ351_007260 [Letrouitia transgressa]